MTCVEVSVLQFLTKVGVWLENRQKRRVISKSHCDAMSGNDRRMSIQGVSQEDRWVEEPFSI